MNAPVISASYQELMSQAQELLRQAEEVRNKDRASAVAKIKAMMDENGITIEDLTGKGSKASKGAKLPAKYKGPNGELWSGGPGRKPEWVKQVLERGEDLEKYRLTA